MLVNRFERPQIEAMIGMWSKYIVLVFLILIFPRLPTKVKKASIAEKDISDDDIDEILWEFIGQCDPLDHIHTIPRFKSTMTRILQLFASVDARKVGGLMFRIRNRMESISNALREEEHLKHVHSTKMATKV